MTDFSHLKKIGNQMGIDRACSGERLGDNELLKIVAGYEPPFLAGNDLEIVLAELDASHPRRRGAPNGGITRRRVIADKLDRIRRKDLPPEFLKVLSYRLRTGRRFPLSRYERQAYRASLRATKTMLIRGLYKDVKHALDTGKKALNYDGLGAWEFSHQFDNLSKSKQALMITNELLRKKLNQNPPGIDRMLNIVSGQE